MRKQRRPELPADRDPLGGHKLPRQLIRPKVLHTGIERGDGPLRRISRPPRTPRTF